MEEKSDRASCRPSRGHWRPGEDDKLRQLVDKYGPQNWNSIAENLKGRSGTYVVAWFFFFLSPPFSFLISEASMHMKQKLAHHP